MPRPVLGLPPSPIAITPPTPNVLGSMFGSAGDDTASVLGGGGAPAVLDLTPSFSKLSVASMEPFLILTWPLSTSISRTSIPWSLSPLVIGGDHVDNL